LKKNYQSISSRTFVLKQSRQIQQVLKQESPDNLSALMHISDKLANLNWERNQAWKTPFTSDNARPAIYTFDGDVYTGWMLIPKDEYQYYKINLEFYLAYGFLKPLDAASLSS
jgi:cytoplasmic iron level regulating protein YaaA (DUF328/UPF0246 family)